MSGVFEIPSRLVRDVEVGSSWTEFPIPHHPVPMFAVMEMPPADKAELPRMTPRDLVSEARLLELLRNTFEAEA